MSKATIPARTRRVDRLGCKVPEYALTVPLLHQYKERVKAKHNIDTIGKNNHQKCDVYLDDDLQPNDREVIFELSNLKSDFGVCAAQNDEDEEAKAAGEAGDKNGSVSAAPAVEESKFSIGFPEQKNGPELLEFTDLIDEICIREGVRHSKRWFDEELETRDVKARFNSVMKKPKKKEALEKFGRAFKVTIDSKKLKKSDVFINGVQCTFQELLNLCKDYKSNQRLKDLDWTLRFKFEKLWFGDKYNAKFLGVRICCFEGVDESDEGFSTIQVQNTNKVNAPNGSNGVNVNAVSSNGVNVNGSNGVNVNGSNGVNAVNGSNGVNAADHKEDELAYGQAGNKRAVADVESLESDPTFSASAKKKMQILETGVSSEA